MGIPSFDQELARYGPDSPSRSTTLAQADALCREWTRGTYENFSVLSWLLPTELRTHFCRVYAYCRWADDLADESGDRETASKRLAWWRTQLDAMFAGEVAHPVFVALLETVREKRLTREPLASLLDAFERDQRQTRYETAAELLSYCRCSADPVGRIVLRLTGDDADERLPLSDSICTGLQWINFCQDVARDWKIGRVYLPLEDLRRHGVSPDAVDWGHATPAFRAALSEQVIAAESMLARGVPLIEQVGPSLRRQLALFVRGGQAIARAIRAQDFDVWSRRPTVDRWSKLALVARTWLWPRGALWT